MASLKFILRPGEKIPGKPVTIYLQYIHQGEKTLFITGHRILPSKWNVAQGKPKGKPGNTLEKTLASIRMDVQEHGIDAVKGDPTPAKVKEAYLIFKEKEKNETPEAVLKESLYARWVAYINYIENRQYKGKKRTAGTIRNNTNTRELVFKFLKENKMENIKPEKFKWADYELLDEWLTTSPNAWLDRHNMPKHGTKSPNGIARVKKQFKAFLKWHLLQEGKLGFNVDRIQYSETAGLKIALTENELVTIANAEVKGRLNDVRDLMVVQACTGVRISDLKRFSNNIDENGDLNIVTKKQGKRILVPIPDLAKQVLKRLEYKLPIIPEQKYREGIKEIYKKLWPNKTIEMGAGDNLREVFVWQEISTHDLVRTFINIASKKGIPIQDIAGVTGKSTGVLLKNYLIEDKESAYKSVQQKFKIAPIMIVDKAG